MQPLSFPTASSTIQDSYTDLNGLQSIKNEADEDVALRKVAQQFESMFINLLLKNMRAANDVLSEGNIFDTQEIKFYRDMHDNQLAVSLSGNESFGIAEAVYRQLSKKQAHSSSDAAELAALPDRNNAIQPSITTSQARALEKNEAQDPDTLASSLATDNASAQTSLPNTDFGRFSLADSPEEFVKKFLPYAEKVANTLGIDPETVLAQAALETGWGKHVLSDEQGEPSFNLFNVKAGLDWAGDTVVRNSLEFLSGAFSSVASKFRAYTSPADSFDDFARFISNSERYQSAVGDSKNGMDFIRRIHQAGYATDPNYVEKVQSVYQRIKAMINEG